MSQQLNEARYQRLSAAGREIWDALALGAITVQQALDELNEQDRRLLEQWAQEDLQKLREHQEKLDSWWRKHQTLSRSVDDPKPSG